MILYSKEVMKRAKISWVERAVIYGTIHGEGARTIASNLGIGVRRVKVYRRRRGMEGRKYFVKGEKGIVRRGNG